MPIHLKTKTEAKTWWQKGCGRRWAMNGVNHKLWGERGSHLSYRNSSIRQSKSIIQTICMQGIQNQKWLFERILYSIRNSIRKRQRKLIYLISHWKSSLKQGNKTDQIRVTSGPYGVVIVWLCAENKTNISSAFDVSLVGGGFANSRAEATPKNYMFWMKDWLLL